MLVNDFINDGKELPDNPNNDFDKMLKIFHRMDGEDGKAGVIVVVAVSNEFITKITKEIQKHHPQMRKVNKSLKLNNHKVNNRKANSHKMKFDA